MVQPIQKTWNPNTLQWEQIVPTKEEFDGLAGTGRTTETVKGNKDQIDVLSQNVNSHLSDEMPHIYKDGTKTYRCGLKVVNGVVTMVYEEVI